MRTLMRFIIVAEAVLFVAAASALILLMLACGKQEPTCCTSAVAKERSKDPVCKMWVDHTPGEHDGAVIVAEYDNAFYYFCAEECKKSFLASPDKYGTKCVCRPRDTNDKCKCEHCSGKHVPCDCR